MAYPSDLVRTKNWGNETLTDSDLEGQFDLIIAWVMAALNSSTGHNHDGTSNQSQKISVASGLTVSSQAQGDILYASSATAFARLGAGTNGQFLKTQGTGANPTWADAITSLTASNALTGSVVQTVTTTTAAYASLGSTAVPRDDSKPTWAEGNEISALQTSITPNSNSNYLLINVVAHISSDADNSDAFVLAIFSSPSGTDECLAAEAIRPTCFGPLTTTPMRLTYKMTSPGTSALTFKFRAGGNSSSDTLVLNGGQTAGARLFGGALVSSVTIQEIKG